jgi:Holliday junction resolvasome RuvABC DNA-binding subunit
MNDAVLALISLGFKQVEAQKAVREVLAGKGSNPADAEELVRQALKLLA